MIVVDTSALVAIALDEPGCDRIRERIEASEGVLLSSVSAVETRMVLLSRKGEGMVHMMDDYLRQARIEIVAPGPDEVTTAYAAFVLYGKGRKHRAQLNFGDLFGYALAKTRSLPLLYEGHDFSHTDIERA